MHWSGIKFNLEKLNYPHPASGDLVKSVVIRSNQFCGLILIFNELGVFRAASVGKSHEFDLDASGRVKFFKGNAPSGIFKEGYNDDPESCVTLESIGVGFELWFNPSAEQLCVSTDYDSLLVINKSGVYRMGNMFSCGLPCDDQGRVKVIR